jgi:hypothetical protein
LQHLLDQAHGRGTTTPGRGWVPLSPEHNDWYEVDVQALQDAPHASAYLLRNVEQDDRRRSYRLAALVVVVMVLALLGWWLWPRPTAPIPVADSAFPLVDGEAVAPWRLQQLVLTTLTSTVTLPISTTTSASWPAHATDAPPLAFWRAPVLLPLALCVPQHLLADATRVELYSTPDVPRRVYTLGDSGTSTPDVVLEACNAQGDTPLAARWGMLDAVVLPPDNAIGQAVSVGDAVLTVEDIRQYGSGEDPNLPPDTARVAVTVVTTASLSWPRLAPTLLLHGGQLLSASSTTATTDGAVLHYLVPLSHEPRLVVWQLSLPPGVGLLRWRAELLPPPSHLSVLREALRVEDVSVTAQTADTVTLALTLHNRAAQPLLLRMEDVVVTQGDRPVVLPELAALGAPLAPDEQRTLSLELPVPPSGEPLIVAFGPFRYRVH